MPGRLEMRKPIVPWTEGGGIRHLMISTAAEVVASA